MERGGIKDKYSCGAALYYRRMLGSWARGMKFEEERPAKNWTELITKKNEEYQISDKASSAYESTTAAVASLWARMTSAE